MTTSVEDILWEEISRTEGPPLATSTMEWWACERLAIPKNGLWDILWDVLTSVRLGQRKLTRERQAKVLGRLFQTQGSLISVPQVLWDEFQPGTDLVKNIGDGVQDLLEAFSMWSIFLPYERYELFLRDGYGISAFKACFAKDHKRAVLEGLPYLDDGTWQTATEAAKFLSGILSIREDAYKICGLLSSMYSELSPHFRGVILGLDLWPLSKRHGDVLRRAVASSGRSFFHGEDLDVATELWVAGKLAGPSPEKGLWVP